MTDWHAAPTRHQVLGVVVIGAAIASLLVAVRVGAQTATQHHSTNDGVVYSGCFHHGRITDIRLDDTEPERCEAIETDSNRGHARHVTWSEVGPQGPDGADSPFEPFYVTLDPAPGETDETVVFAYGSITVKVACTLLDFDPMDPPAVDRVEVIVTSSEDGWYLEDEDEIPQAANAEVVVASWEFESGLFPTFINTIDDAVVGTPAGHVVGWDGESLAVGLGVFDHTCLATGNIWAMTGSP